MRKIAISFLIGFISTSTFVYGELPIGYVGAESTCSTGKPDSISPYTLSRLIDQTTNPKKDAILFFKNCAVYVREGGSGSHGHSTTEFKDPKAIEAAKEWAKKKGIRVANYNEEYNFGHESKCFVGCEKAGRTDKFLGCSPSPCRLAGDEKVIHFYQLIMQSPEGQTIPSDFEGVAAQK